MADDLYGFEEEDAAPKGRDNLFLWTVFILLLIGVAFACWLGSFYVFGHPEQPRAYKILKKLNKIQPPRRFEAIGAPPGEFLTAQRLFERYGKFSRLELERENAELLRNYINNYRETKKLIPYVRGRFNIIGAYELQESDLFASGVVALAQANDYPQVMIEHVYTSAPEAVPTILKHLQIGLDMPIEKTHDLAAVIHIEKVFDGRLQFTVVPLLYGNYAVKHGVGTFALEPPKDINLTVGAPIIRGTRLEDGLKNYASFRRTRPGASPVAGMSADPEPQMAETGPELVRLDALPAGVKAPETGALPEMPVATPVPVPGRTAVRKATPPVVLAMNNRATPPPATPAPAVPPIQATILENSTGEPRTVQPVAPVEPQAVPVATPIPVRPGVPLKPFIASNPAPATGNTGRSWRTYPPGKAPPGRRISPSEAAPLADEGDLGETTYLRGQFVVTASHENRAVLRPQGGAAESRRPGAGAARIIVEYPGGLVPPTEGSTFSRDDSRPFQIYDVRRGADGQVNIYVREITAEER
jgi:hypothetical protein